MTSELSVRNQHTGSRLNNTRYRPPTKLREANVFTGVCHSVHSGRGGISLVRGPFQGVGYFWSHVPSMGVEATLAVGMYPTFLLALRSATEVCQYNRSIVNKQILAHFSQMLPAIEFVVSGSQCKEEQNPFTYYCYKNCSIVQENRGLCAHRTWNIGSATATEE